MNQPRKFEKRASPPGPVHLDQPGWEQVFRTAPVPLFIEDISLVRQAISRVKAGGVDDFGAWLDAHPEFITQSMGLTRIVDVNDAAVTLNAAANRDDILQGLDRLLVPESVPGLKGVLKAIGRDDPYFEGECQYRTLDGRHYFTLNQAWIPGPDQPGDLMVFATIDITDLKRAQQDLADSEQRYRLVVETAHDVVIRHDLSGRVTFVNRAGCELTGYPAGELIGRNALDLIPGDLHRDFLERKKQSSVGSGGPELFETEVVDVRGRGIPMEVSSSLIPGTAVGEEPQVLLVARDITGRKLAERERRELEARLWSAQKLESLGVLAGGIAHDFNNLLVTIMGNTELVRGDEPEGSSNQRSLDAVLEAAGRAADLCRQMQAYAGEGPLSQQPEDLSRLIRDIERLLQVSVSKRSHLHFELPDGLPPVMVDTPQIRQVVMNLVSNAAESLGDEGGEIMIRTGVKEVTGPSEYGVVGGNSLPAESYVFCEVRDSGCGMENEVAERIFDPFFTTKFPGHGLGLSAALGVINSHHGGFTMKTGPLDGTTIRFLLPVHRSAPPPLQKRRTRSPEAGGVDLKGKLILMVDDDPSVRAVGESCLRRMGCQVLSAADGFEAVRIFGERHGDVDAVLLDFTMTGMDGLATYRRLRVIRSDIPVVFSSGHDAEEVAAKTESLDVAGFMAKPYTLKMMRQVLAEVLSSAEN